MTDFSEFRNKKLYRSQSNRMLGGVCGGIAEYFSIDPNLVRLIWVAISLLGGFGVLVYIASLFIIPNNPDQTPVENAERLIKDKYMFWGSLLIIVGVFLILRQTGLFYAFNFWHIPWQSVWAILLIGIGILLLLNRQKATKGEQAEGNEKKLYRSRSQKMIAGVCGGLAEYFEIDVSVVRILWVIGTLLSAGVGILIYVAMFFLFPESPEEYNHDLKV
jgi:phage shock protein PspC (stress-responsive transcriptional regulator)